MRSDCGMVRRLIASIRWAVGLCFIIGCGNCQKLSGADPAVVRGCEEVLFVKLNRPVALRLTTTVQGFGQTRVVAVVQIVDSKEQVDNRIQQTVSSVIRDCYPNRVDETVVEPISPGRPHEPSPR